VQKLRNPKLEKLAEVESAREKLPNADMGTFDRAMRALLKVSSDKIISAPKARRKR
jgi:hypothetical protein